jgi:hypothetical protein
MSLFSLPNIVDLQGFAGLDCWIAQSGLQSNLVDLNVIDNLKSKLDFGFGLSILFFYFDPNPKKFKFFLRKLKFHGALGFNHKNPS